MGGTGFEEGLGRQGEEHEVLGNEVEEEDLQDLFNDEPVPAPATPPTLVRGGLHKVSGGKLNNNGKELSYFPLASL